MENEMAEHAYAGLCPDPTQPDSRDPKCPACKAMLEAARMSRESRAMLLNVLWHHQGGSSSVGQPLRALLGIGQFDHLTLEQIAEAKWIDRLLALGRAQEGGEAKGEKG